MLPHNQSISRFNLLNIGISANLKGFNHDKSVHIEIGYHVGKNQFYVEVQPMKQQHFFLILQHNLDYLIKKTNLELAFRGHSGELFLNDEQKSKLIEYQKITNKKLGRDL